jgi:hypothetical protein
MAGPIHDDAASHGLEDVELSASENRDGVASVSSNPEPLGKHFPIEWVITAPLPFRRIRHLRNLWNGNV